MFSLNCSFQENKINIQFNKSYNLCFLLIFNQQITPLLEAKDDLRSKANAKQIHLV